MEMQMEVVKIRWDGVKVVKTCWTHNSIKIRYG